MRRKSAIELLFDVILSRAAAELPKAAADAAELKQLDARDSARGYGGGYNKSGGWGGPEPIGGLLPEDELSAAAAAAYCKVVLDIALNPLLIE